MVIRSDIVRSHDDLILNAYLEVKNEFPFPDYMNYLYLKYSTVASEILKKYELGSNILSIGSGPCDFEAILSKLGYNVVAVDDLNDQWHKIGSNRNRIINFAKKMNVDLLVQPMDSIELKKDHFDLILALDIIEHLHNSPREFLNKTISYLKFGGGLFIETPNLASLANRLKLLSGKSSNSVDINSFYWNIGDFRAHFREYTRGELIFILTNQNLIDFEIKMLNIMTEALIIKNKKNSFKKIFLQFYKFLVDLYPNFRDTIIIYGKKPVNWSPSEPSVDEFIKIYPHLNKFNLDDVNDESLFTSFEG
jgi:2-polyprenyl-3-methyl-5-hydroxy-6-metoxy-1,4-benzoquinol methylase